jgi:hypothetical protein
VAVGLLHRLETGAGLRDDPAEPTLFGGGGTKFRVDRSWLPGSGDTFLEAGCRSLRHFHYQRNVCAILDDLATMHKRGLRYEPEMFGLRRLVAAH